MSQISNLQARVVTPDRNTRQISAGTINQTPSEARINGTQANRSSNIGLGVGDRGPEVQQAQQLLDEAGHAPGPIDGIFGSKTQDAAQAFQQERIDSLNETLQQGPPAAARSVLAEQIRNLENELADGVIGDETIAQLNNAERDVNVRSTRSTDLEVGDRGPDVLVAQQALADAGHSHNGCGTSISARAY